MRPLSARVAETAISTFGSIDALINNAGIFFTKPFTDYTTGDFKRLISTNLDGFIYMTQLAIKQMLAQKSGESIVSITASLTDNPIAGVNASIPMITKGGINAITRSLAIEYAERRDPCDTSLNLAHPVMSGSGTCTISKRSSSSTVLLLADMQMHAVSWHSRANARVSAERNACAVKSASFSR